MKAEKLVEIVKLNALLNELSICEAVDSVDMAWRNSVSWSGIEVAINGEKKLILIMIYDSAKYTSLV